ncbi:MAG: T9SS type A sorting domain-containing protein [Bacteroidales bacterium]|nr:T9SS type A sorting domain-containing protein [Bacteroidales bacterium]
MHLNIKAMLDAAPNCGPYFWDYTNYNTNCCGSVPGFATNGWASGNRFRNPPAEQDGQIPQTNPDDPSDPEWDRQHSAVFNGLDYMFLYNLYHLIENPEPFVNMISRNLDETFPQGYTKTLNLLPVTSTETGSTTFPLTVQSYEEIECSSILDDHIHNTDVSIIGQYVWVPDYWWTGIIGIGHWELISLIQNSNQYTGEQKYSDVRLVSGESVKLKQGFRVKEGSKFIAKIKDFRCYPANYKSSENCGGYSEIPLINSYDSIYWNPMRPKFGEVSYTNEDSNIGLLEDDNKSKNTIEQLEISPNPFSNYLNIKSTDGNIDLITIFNQNGSKILERKTRAIEVQFELDILPKGLYIVVVRTEDGMESRQKVVKE